MLDKQTFAVDAPDGDPDWHLKEELIEVSHLIDDAANLEDRDKIELRHLKQKQHAKLDKKTFAVDSPDGETEWHLREEAREVDHIIGDAAEVENRSEIDKRHLYEQAIKKDRARDPEHDW